MNKLVLRKLLTSALYFVASFAIESFLYLHLGWGFFATYPLFDLAMMLFFALIIFSCKSKVAADIILWVLLSLQMIICYLNMIMMSMLSTVFSVSMISLVGETVEVIAISMFPFLPLIFFAILIAVVVTCLVFINKIKVDDSKNKQANKYAARFAVLIGMTLSLVLYSVQGAFIKKSSKDTYLLGDNYLYNTFSSDRLSLRKFGSFGFYTEQLARLLVKPEPLLKINKAELEKYLNTETYNPQDSALWNVLAKDGTDNNIFVIMGESFEWYAISPEITPVLYALANGYDFGENGERLYDIYEFYEKEVVGEDGEIYTYTDLQRKDYDYDEETNTFTKKEGVEIFTGDFEQYGLTLINYYSKAKTDYSEASVVLGNYPYNKSFVERAGLSGTGIYADVDYNFSLPNTLKDSGYINEGQAEYFHTYKPKFYDRSTLLPRFGFDKATFFDTWTADPVIKHTDKLSCPILDSEVMSEFGNTFIHRDEDGNRTSEGPWLSFLTTVTTHGQYSTYSELLDKHCAFVDSVDYAGKKEGVTSPKTLEGQVRIYLASCLDTEYMVAHLLNHLANYNEFDNTTIVFYGDHNGYYDHLDSLYKTYYYNDQYTDFDNFRSNYYKEQNQTGEYGLYASEKYSVASFIYSKELDKTISAKENGEKMQYIEKFTCAFDLTPTILTMCGIQFNPHYYLGTPVLCTQYINGEAVEVGTKVIASHTGGYFNNRIFSEDGLHANYKVDGVTEAEMKQFSIDTTKYLEKWNYINALYDYNMFQKVPKRTA